VRVLIADDEPIARQVLREHIESIPGLEVAGEASTGPETLQCILDLQPDLVLLDLQMPELDGLATARFLRGTRTPAVIFVTAYERHALEAFEVGAVDYVLKPVRRERLEQAVEKVRKQTPAHNGAPAVSSALASASAGGTLRKIVGRRGGDMYLLDPSEIVAFQAEGELVHIVTASETKPGRRYLSDHCLKTLEEKLEQPRFRRVHRATIINTDHIRKISPLSSKRWLLKMSNGFEAVVSKRLAGSIREQGRW
jgi:two-component system, LytTR family, response regulator